jgi:hypothetical protein
MIDILLKIIQWFGVIGLGLLLIVGAKCGFSNFAMCWTSFWFIFCLFGATYTTFILK